MKILPENPTEQMVKTIASGIVCRFLARQIYENLYASSPSVEQEPIGYITGESIYRLNVHNGNDSKGTVPIHKNKSKASRHAVYTTPPDQSKRIADLESKLAECVKALEYFTNSSGAEPSLSVAWHMADKALAKVKTK